jgi:N-acetylglucosamine-6-sulfatase
MPAAERQTIAAERPNIVLIMTDDQYYSTIRYMPTLQGRLAAKGAKFVNYYAADPYCCPNRASLLRGQYPHNHGIRENKNGAEKFRSAGLDKSTVATWLRSRGYRTAYFGKYINHYSGTYVPPGWDRFAAYLDDGNLNRDRIRYNDNGRVKSFNKNQIHESDFLAKEATEWVGRRSGPHVAPFFAMIAPHTPHQPVEVAPRHEGMFRNKPLPRPPSFNERDVSDKPHRVRRRPLTNDERRRMADHYRQALASLQAVDDLVRKVLGKLKDRGELDNTYVIYTTDNGWMYGVHRLEGKKHHYEESSRLPLIVRGPGVPAGVMRPQLVGTVDLAPTIADFAGVAPAGFVDGRSFKPLLRPNPPRAGAGWRDALLIEHNSPTYRAIGLANNTKYIEWASGAREYYDLSDDPYELTSRPRRAPASLHDRLAVLKGCARAGCRAADGGR